MSKYHVNSKGSLSVCKAKIDNCPLGSDGEHINADSEFDANIINAERIEAKLTNALQSISSSARFWERPDFLKLSIIDRYNFAKNFNDKRKERISNDEREEIFKQKEQFKEDFRNLLISTQDQKIISDAMLDDNIDDSFIPRALLRNPNISKEQFKIIVNEKLTNARYFTPDVECIVHTDHFKKMKEEILSLPKKEKLRILTDGLAGNIGYFALIDDEDIDVRQASIKNFKPNESFSQFVIKNKDQNIVKEFVINSQDGTLDYGGVIRGVIEIGNDEISRIALDKTNNEYALDSALRKGDSLSANVAKGPKVDLAVNHSYYKDLKNSQYLKDISVNPNLKDGIPTLYKLGNTKVNVNLINHPNASIEFLNSIKHDGSLIMRGLVHRAISRKMKESSQ